MRMLLTLAVALVATTTAIPALAKTIEVVPGPDAQAKLQEALILAEPGDTVQLAAGRFVLTDGLSLDANGVTVRGSGMDTSILDFSGQKGAGEGLLVTSDDVTLRDFAVENAKGDAIKSKGADRIVYYRVRAEWTGGPKETNGAYGIYPVESTGVLIDNVVARGASDAGIYVGQSRDITIRNSVADGNVAGIEIENSRNALVQHNYVTRNTGGILVFDLPSLPVMGGGNVVVSDNLVVGNDTPNFAPKGNIVASVRRGTGIMVMANEGVTIVGNQMWGNPTAHVMVISYPMAFTDTRYNPTPRGIVISSNRFKRGGYDPQIAGAPALLAAFGGSLPPIMWDGLGEPPKAFGFDNSSAWTLNLPKQAASQDQARPAPLELPKLVPTPPRPGPPTPPAQAPEALDARIAR